MLQRAGLGGLLLAMLAANAMAQATLTIGSSTLEVGQSVKLTYSDRSRAGQSIWVRMSSGAGQNGNDEIQIHLDQQGRGSVSWTVPNWFCVFFTAPDVSEFSMDTESADGEDDAG